MVRTANGNPLGAFLQDRRAKLDPARVGLPLGRRRTRGLRREEVALRAGVSVTWYTFLEQGRGGRPSAEVLDCLAVALDLSDAERQHLYLLAQNRPPEPEFQPVQNVSPQTQRLLDALDLSRCPAYVRTPAWNVLAWNTGAIAMFGDYFGTPEQERNLLTMYFLDPSLRERNPQWEEVAAALVAAFRAEMTLIGAAGEAAVVASTLSERSPEFRALWQRHDIEVRMGTAKTIVHPELGPVTFETSTVRLADPGNLSLVVFNPVNEADRARVGEALASSRTPLHEPGSAAS